jgi:hypothetical protein
MTKLMTLHHIKRDPLNLLRMDQLQPLVI